jgi:PAS domain S-box-containing protein
LKISSKKVTDYTNGSITRRLVLHATIAVFFLLTVISITIWSSNTLTMITTIARFERTHTVSRLEAMVALLKYLQSENPAEMETFKAKMELTQSYNRVFSQLINMRESIPGDEFVRILESTFREADQQTAEIIVNRVSILYNNPFLIELVDLAARGNVLGEQTRILVEQMAATDNKKEQRAIFAEIVKIEKEIVFLENSFSKRCGDLAVEVAAYVNYISIALLILCVGFISLLTYLITKALLRQVMSHTVKLEREIHERNIAETELRHSEITFRKLFEDSSDAILLIDDTGAFVQCNQAALNILKMTREQFLLRSPAELSPEFQPDGQRSAEAAPKMIALAHSKGLHRFEWTHINTAKDAFIVEVSLMPITIKGQTMLHTTWRDITEQKRAEEENRKLESQLQQVQKIESIGQLAGGVAHDFNNMLGVILGHVDLVMMNAEATNPHIKNMEEIKKAAKRSADLTRQLLAFARKQTVVPVVLDLNKTVAGMLQMLQRLIGENITLFWQPEESLWPVMIDPSQIDQILAISQRGFGIQSLMVLADRLGFPRQCRFITAKILAEEQPDVSRDSITRLQHNNVTRHQLRAVNRLKRTIAYYHTMGFGHRHDRSQGILSFAFLNKAHQGIHQYHREDHATINIVL